MKERKKETSNWMKILVVLILGLWFLPVSAGAEEVAKRAELQQMYMDYLKGEGYKPEIDSDGDVGFKKEGRYYYVSIQAQEKDPEFFRLVFPKFWKIESEKERSQVLAAADQANAIAKVSKVYTQDDNVWASAEILVDRPEHAKAVFKRALATVENAVSTFLTKMKEKS